MKNLFSVEGKVVVMTGACGILGSTIVKHFAEQGAKVVLLDLERTREVAQARQIAMYLAKQHTKAPLTAIGAAIGGRNHATVLHSCKAVQNLIETDKQFRYQIEEIEKAVLA